MWHGFRCVLINLKTSIAATRNSNSHSSPNYSNSHTRTPHSPHYSNYRRKNKREHRTTVLFQKTPPYFHFQSCHLSDVMRRFRFCVASRRDSDFYSRQTNPVSRFRRHVAKPRPAIRIRTRRRTIRRRIHEPRIRPTPRITAEKTSAFRHAGIGNGRIEIIAKIG